MSSSNQQPAEIAIALKYSPEKDSAPVIVASGNGHMAQKIIDLATQSNIPVYQDNTAASLLSKFQLGSEIPSELYQIVAEVYSYILHSAEQYQSQQEFEPFDSNAYDAIEKKD